MNPSTASRELAVEVAVIGAGTAGLAAYRAAVSAGKRAVIIEGGPYGTTCARVGCMPSKLLIAAAEAAHAPARWEAFGLKLDGRITIDGAAVMQRVKHERDRFVGFVLDGVNAIPEGDRIRGHARFVDDRTLEVGAGTRITFGRAVIATGSSPSVPAFLRKLEERVVVNDDVFDWDDLPRSVAVIGPGVIGLEIGQALARLGVRTIVFGRMGHVGPFTDPQVRAYAIRTFAREFTLESDADLHGVERVAEGVRITYANGEGEPTSEVVDLVIAATGRMPNVRNLGLENTTLELDVRGVPAFDRHTMQCGHHPIFIAGDASDDMPLLHEAADEGRIAGHNAAKFPHVEPGLRRTPLAIVFSDPQLALAGARFADLEPGTFVTGEVSFEDQGRSRVMLRNVGLLHVYADLMSGRLLGAEMIGPDAEHIAHLLAWVIQQRLTLTQTLEMPFYHPVVEEGLRTALRDAQHKFLDAERQRAMMEKKEAELECATESVNGALA
ncbi:MAG TPA: dihydrolipoyl dehydrogenase [Casimicrobiaceae bacterium]|nr:dihydrolipoyl dehydrogenase [Casimicrobiaceae bacterium]